MRLLATSLAAILAGLAGTSTVSAWGFVAHRIVIDNAAATLPEPLAAFYRANQKLLSDAGIEPDSLLKDREGEKEKRRHYIDLDELSRPPFRDLPFDEERARALYGDDRVDHAGLLPWRILAVLDQLREGFRSRNWSRVISRSGWLSHYVADAYQPLHTTRNHDGQETCNLGVHAAFETEMIDRLRARYRVESAPLPSFTPEVIREPRRFLFGEIFDGYTLVARILQADTEAMAAVKNRRADYYDEMERAAGPLARRQLSRAAATTASLWYTVWFQAGRPAPPAAAVPREARP